MFQELYHQWRIAPVSWSRPFRSWAATGSSVDVAQLLLSFLFLFKLSSSPPSPHPPSPQKNMHLFLQTLSYMFNELFSQGYRPIALNLATSTACAAYSLFRSHKGFLADTPWSTYSLLVAAPPPRGPNSQ